MEDMKRHTVSNGDEDQNCTKTFGGIVYSGRPFHPLPSTTDPARHLYFSDHLEN